jgi:hypothetical protein
VIRDDVLEAHEVDQLHERGRGVAEHDPATEPARSELKARERVHRDRVRIDAGHVAEGEGGAATA